MRDADTSLDGAMGPADIFVIVTPGPGAQQLRLSPVAEWDAEGVRELKGLYFGELALLEDVARDSPRSLTRIMGGVTQARVADLRHALAGYFCVPESQLDVGLSRFDSVCWDGLTGLIDWGTSTGLQLR